MSSDKPYVRGSEAPNSRLFIVGTKGCTESETRAEFEKYGTLRDLWFVKDRQTNEDKGIIYVTYTKASEAALAQEELNGKHVGGSIRPIKVIIASDKQDGGQSRDHDDEKIVKIFIKCSRDTKEDDLKEAFKAYGDINFTKVIRDKSSGESKGLAYVAYHRPYHAALALENCDPSYKPIFAKVKKYDDRPSGSSSSHGGFSDYSQQTSSESYARGQDYYSNATSYGDYSNSGSAELEVTFPSQISHSQGHRLFDIVPTLEAFNLDTYSGTATVRYSNSQWAAYAKEKLDGLEYPPGCKIRVREAGYVAAHAAKGSGWGDGYSHSDLTQNLQNYQQNPDIQSNLATLVSSIKKATEVLQSAGIGVEGASAAGNYNGTSIPEGRASYTNIDLPSQQPLADKDAPLMERLFLVSQPTPISVEILQDALCRFGNLIEAFFIPGRNFGYAKFASKESAAKAMDVLHGQYISGSRLKVLPADPSKQPSSKRSEGPSFKRARHDS